MGSEETPGANTAERVSRERFQMLKRAANGGECGRKFPTFLFVINRLCGWRRRWDSNPRYAFTHAGFQDRCIRPLCHSSDTVPLYRLFRFWKTLKSGDFRRNVLGCFSCTLQNARLRRNGIGPLMFNNAGSTGKQCAETRWQAKGSYMVQHIMGGRQRWHGL